MPEPGVAVTDAALVHEPVTDATGRITAYTLHDAVPHQRAAPDDTLDAEYERTDLPALAAGRQLFVQATRRVLAGQDATVVPHVHAAQTERPQVSAMVAWRYARGLPTGLTRFTGREAEVALLPRLTVVGVDAAQPDNRLGELIDLAHGSGLTVVVEEVHTADDQQRSFELGADLVQGRIIPTGELERGGLAAGELTCLELLSLLTEDVLDLDAVTGLIAADPNLTIGALHLVNSAVFGLPRRVDSVRQAVVMIGPRLLWALATTSMNQAARSDTDELWQVLTRALACWDLSGDDSGYTVGLLSAVADQRRVDPGWLATMAGLSEEATAALVGLRGPVGAALASIRAYEFGDPRVATGFAIEPPTVSRAWLKALPEALGIAAALTSA